MLVSDVGGDRFRCPDCARVIGARAVPCWCCGSRSAPVKVGGRLGITIDQILARIDQLQTPRTLDRRPVGTDDQAAVWPCEICDRPAPAGAPLCRRCEIDLGFEHLNSGQQRIKLVQVLQQTRNPF